MNPGIELELRHLSGVNAGPGSGPIDHATTSASHVFKSSHRVLDSEMSSPILDSGLKRVNGPYYGHETTARMCTRFLTHLFGCPTTPTSVATGSRAKLPHFIAYALHRTKLHPSMTFAALILLQRLKTRFLDRTSLSGHRLFISAYMIASKTIYDVTYLNQSWGIVSRGMFSVKDINQMEREMCEYLEWEFIFDSTTLSNFEDLVTKDFSQDRESYPSYPPSVVSRGAGGGTSIGTQVAVDPVTPSPSSNSDPPSPQLQTDGPDEPPSSPPLAFSGNTPSLSYSNTASPTTTEPPQTPISSQNRPGGTSIRLENGSPPLFTVVDELPPLHPLAGQMFAFAVPSNF